MAWPAFFALMVAAVFSAGATALVAMPCRDGHMPPPCGLVPQTVWKPKRTCPSSWVMPDSMADFRLYQLVLVMSAHTASPVFPLRQWNMLPDRSTSSVTVGIMGVNMYMTSVHVFMSAANLSMPPGSGRAASRPAVPPDPDPEPPPDPVPGRWVPPL